MSVAGGSLAAEGVAVMVGERAILRPTTLCFAPGLVVGVLGHNGSGKSTLLKCLARQLAPSVGRVTLDGTPAAAWGARAFARRLAYLPQQTPAATGLTGRELVAFGRYPWHGPLGAIGAAGRAAVADAMALTGTAPFADRAVDLLSGGERQRVWIAMAVAQDTAFVLLDEPIAALDLGHQMEVLGTLRTLARSRNAGIVLVLHDITMAARFCDRLVALRGGAVVADGTPADLLRPDVLEGLYGIPMRVLRDPASGAPVAVPA